MHDPVRVDLSEDRVDVDWIQNVAYVLRPEEPRTRSLLAVLEAEDPVCAIIFCNTRSDTEAATEGFSTTRVGVCPTGLGDDILSSVRTDEGTMKRVHAWTVAAGVLLAAAPLWAGPVGECSPYGANAHIPDEATLEALADAGIAWVRMDFNWFMIEPKKGEFHFEVLDQAVDQARSRGINVFATLGYSPKWAVAAPGCQDGTSDPCMTKPPANITDWSDFVFATVSHFKGRVRHWGMWNEPNLKAFFEGTLDDYVDRILVPGAQAVRWADPSALVLGPELAGLGDSSQWNGENGSCVFGVCTFNGWEIDLAQVLERAGSSIDIITHHFYKKNATALMEAVLDGEYDSLIGLVKTHSSLKEIVEKYYPNKDVWLTEYGWETPAYGGWSGGGSVSEANQAAYHVAFLDARERVVTGTWDASDNDPWPNLSRVFLYDARDSVVDGHLYAFGILRVDGTPKPAWAAIRDFIAAHPPSCPPQPPAFQTLPVIALEQGSAAPRAVDLWLYTLDPDTPVHDLMYTLVDAGDPGAGVVIEDAHFLSAYPDPAFQGFTVGRVRADDGQFQAEADFGVSVKPVVLKTYEAAWLGPTLDGDLSEWGGVAQVQLVIEKDWVGLDTGLPAGPTDLAANGRITWDESHLYLAFEVTDNTHVANEPAETLWLGDSVQFALDLGGERTPGAYDDVNDWEVGVALAAGGVLIHCFHAPAGAGHCPVQAYVLRKGNRTSYEVAFLLGEMPPKSFGMTFLANENDGSGREGFLQWTPGIGLSKDPSRFAVVTRVGGPPPEVAPEVPPDLAEPEEEGLWETPGDEPGPAETPGEEASPVLEPAAEEGPGADAAVDTPPEASEPGGTEGPAASGGGCGCGQSGRPPVGEALLFLAAFALHRTRRWSWRP